MNFSDGIRRRDFQFDTAESRTPANLATAVVPPRASMIASTESSIGPKYSRFVNKSSVHGMAIVTGCELLPDPGMSRSPKDVAKRLEMTREALGISAAELCRQAKIAPNAWSQFVNPKTKRRITLAASYKLKDAFGVTLEWVYDGDPARLPYEIAQKLRKAA